MECIKLQFAGNSGIRGVPTSIVYRYCPKDPSFHWRVSGDKCPVCNSDIVEIEYKRPQ
jgi:hypothetical protein